MDWADLDSDICAVTRAAALVGDAWTLVLLRDLFNGIRRFDDLAAHLGVARNVLTRRLAALVDGGVATREPYREPGSRVRHEYRLTDAGRDLLPVLLALKAWGDTHLVDGTPPVRVEHRDCGEPVHLVLRCAAGHDVDLDRGVRTRLLPEARRPAAHGSHRESR